MAWIMEKLDPELTDKSVGLGPRYIQLTNLLLKGRNNILVCNEKSAEKALSWNNKIFYGSCRGAL